MRKDDDFVCLRAWLDLGEIALIHSRLGGSGIPYYIENENCFALDGGFSVGHDGLTRLFVDARREAEARRLLRLPARA